MSHSYPPLPHRPESTPPYNTPGFHRIHTDSPGQNHNLAFHLECSKTLNMSHNQWSRWHSSLPPDTPHFHKFPCTRLPDNRYCHRTGNPTGKMSSFLLHYIDRPHNSPNRNSPRIERNTDPIERCSRTYPENIHRPLHLYRNNRESVLLHNIPHRRCRMFLPIQRRRCSRHPLHNTPDCFHKHRSQHPGCCTLW